MCISSLLIKICLCFTLGLSGAFAKDSAEDIQMDKAVGALIGLAIGDAIGTSVEFKKRDTFKPLTDKIGGGEFKLKPGEWTDDTSMALCLGDSLLSKDEFDPKDLMERFVRWYKNGENSSNGKCFDIGITTRTALENYITNGILITDSDVPDGNASAGNGSIMRLAPVSILYHGDEEKAMAVARAQSLVTHQALESKEGSALLALILNRAINGAPKEAILSIPDFKSPAPAVQELVSENASWRLKSRDQIKSSGYVIHTLEAALWCVANTNNYKDAVLLAANLGDDADTVAAVTGQIAGALYGFKSMPPKWVQKIVQGKRIEKLAVDLF